MPPAVPKTVLVCPTAPAPCRTVRAMSALPRVDPAEGDLLGVVAARGIHDFQKALRRLLGFRNEKVIMMRECGLSRKRDLRTETDSFFVQPLGDVLGEKLVDRGLRQAKEVVHCQYGLDEVIHLLRLRLSVGGDCQFAVAECHAEPLQDFMELGFAFRGFKPYAAHFQVGERFTRVGERPTVYRRDGINLDLVVVAIQKRRGDLGVVTGLTAAELRFEPSEVRSDKVSHTNNGSSAAGGRLTMPFLSMW